MRLLPAALLMLVFPVAHAAVVPVPDTGWGINLNLPDLANAQDRPNGPNYSYEAKAGNFIVSLFVEKPKNGKTANADVYRYYWPRAARNPMIDQTSVHMTEQPDFVRVDYFYSGVADGSLVRMKSFNYYFAHEGKWVDVHLSVSHPAPTDDAAIGQFEAALKAVSLDAAKPADPVAATPAPSTAPTTAPGLKTLSLGPDRTISYTAAPGWAQSQMTGAASDPLQVILLKKDAASEVQLMLMAIAPQSPLATQANPADGLAAFHKISCAQYVRGSVEGAYQVKPWLADGLESSFTARAYGGKPAPAGSFRVVTRLTTVVGPVRSGVLVSAVLLSQDLDGSDFAAMKAMVASLALGTASR